jgi:hypothetical protein
MSTHLVVLGSDAHSGPKKCELVACGPTADKENILKNVSKIAKHSDWLDWWVVLNCTVSEGPHIHVQDITPIHVEGITAKKWEKEIPGRLLMLTDNAILEIRVE